MEQLGNTRTLRSEFQDGEKFSKKQQIRPGPTLYDVFISWTQDLFSFWQTPKSTVSCSGQTKPIFDGNVPVEQMLIDSPNLLIGWEINFSHNKSKLSVDPNRQKRRKNKIGIEPESIPRRWIPVRCSPLCDLETHIHEFARICQLLLNQVGIRSSNHGSLELVSTSIHGWFDQSSTSSSGRLGQGFGM